MSYPRVVQVLIVEDEIEPKGYYEEVFTTIAENGRYSLAPARFALCYSDGEVALASNTIFHLVILDLRLPEGPIGEAPNGLDYGLRLLQRCSERNAYPIPAVLVISGYLGTANQGELERRARDHFAHGRVLVKGENINADIESAVRHVDLYTGVGVHLADGGARSYPTLSPREEDLLRRAVLGQQECCGLDMRWWSADYVSDPTGRFSGWTKVLMGAFLLGKGRGRSRPTFFKLMSAVDAEAVLSVARVMEHKLPHIKVLSALVSGDRSLLVTQKVGETDEEPITLAELLGRSSGVSRSALHKVVSDVAVQLDRLGDTAVDRRPIADSLWPHHRPEVISEIWRRFSGPEILVQEAIVNPVDLLQRLRNSAVLVRFGRKTVSHGDLNISNVAVDIRSEGLSGYIFDASGALMGNAVYDLATLEVTALLHQQLDGVSLVDSCKEVYSADVELSDFEEEGEPRAAVVRNTLDLIVEIRRQALRRAGREVYACAVFDVVMQQLGGLAFTVSQNKIAFPHDAVKLSNMVSEWAIRVAGGLLAGG